MVYTRRARRRKTSKKATGWNWKMMAKKAFQTSRFLAEIVNAEQKTFDVSNTATPSTTSGCTWISALGEGDSYANRQGISIKAASINIGLQFVLNSVATVPASIRFLLFYDMLPDQSVPLANDILSGGQVITAPLAVEGMKRYKVLRDIRLTLSPNGMQARIYKVFKRLRFHISWINDNATQNAVSKNHIYFLCFSDQAANLPTLNYYSRLRYYDN